MPWGRAGFWPCWPRAPPSSTRVRMSPMPRTTASAQAALVQHHHKDGPAAGGEQRAGHEQLGHPALAGAVGHPPLGPVAAAQPAAREVPCWLLPAPVTTT